MGSFLSIVHPKASTLSGLFSMVSAIEVNYEVVGNEKEDALDVDGAVEYFPARSIEKIVIDGDTYDELIAKGGVFADLVERQRLDKAD